MRSPSPAFSFYPKDWLSDANVKAMTLEARGAYIELLSICWLESGLPSDHGRLSRLLGVSRRTFERLWPMLSPCFSVDGEQLMQRRLSTERIKQEQRRDEQVRKGKLGGRPKGSTKEKSRGLAPAFFEESRTKAEKSLPSPSPSPSPSPLTDNNGNGLTDSEPPARPPLTAAVVAPSSSWSREACDDWTARFAGTAPGGQIGKALKALVDRDGWGAVRPAWRNYLAQTEAEYASPSRFASTFGAWSGSSAPARAAPKGAQGVIDAGLAFIRAGKEGA